MWIVVADKMKGSSPVRPFKRVVVSEIFGHFLFWGFEYSLLAVLGQK